MKAILKREIKGYFSSLTAYIFIAFMLVVIGFFSTYYNFTYGFASFSGVLYSCWFIFLVLMPFLTMRMFAMDIQDKTINLLYSLPCRMSSIVISKYLAALSVFAVPFAVMCAYPLILSIFGNVNFTLEYSCLLAFFLLGAALISVGMFISSMCSAQSIAAITGFGAMLLIYLMPDVAGMIPTSAIASVIGYSLLIVLISLILYRLTDNQAAAVITAFSLEVILWALYFINPVIFEGLFPMMLNKISLFTVLTGFLNGLFDLSGIVMYLSVIFIFCFLTVQSLEKKRYN
ncbi:MAG: ABC transporter [Ruminococcaceae bacterium]|nr:ABC transporter [Oscillospiraceae bacterium]